MQYGMALHGTEVPFHPWGLQGQPERKRAAPCCLLLPGTRRLTCTQVCSQRAPLVRTFAAALDDPIDLGQVQSVGARVVALGQSNDVLVGKASWG